MTDWVEGRATRTGRRDAGGGSELAELAIALHEEPPPPGNAGTQPPPKVSEGRRHPRQARIEAQDRKNRRRRAAPGPRGWRRCESSSHRHPSPPELLPRVRPLMPSSSSTMASAPSCANAAPRRRRSPPPPPPPPPPTSWRPSRAAARAARSEAHEQTLRELRLHRLAGPPPPPSRSRELRSSATLLRPPPRRRTPRGRRTCPVCVAGGAVQPAQSPASMPRLRGFSNCFDLVTYSARTAASKRCETTVSGLSIGGFPRPCPLFGRASPAESSNGGWSRSREVRA